MRIFGFEITRASKTVGSLGDSGLIFGTQSLSTAGQTVTAETAMQLSAVFGCIRLISSTFATLPLIMYRRLPNGGKERATKHPLYNVLRRKPNVAQNSAGWKQMLQAHILLRGNAYNRIISNKRGVITELVPLNPNRMSVRAHSDGLIYEYWNSSNTKEIYEDWEILHLKNLSLDGITGIDPIMYMKNVIGKTLAIETHSANYFTNGARLGGILKHPGKLTEEGIAKIRTGFQNKYGGSENAYKTAVLEEGMDYQAIGATMEQSQYLQQEQFSKRDIAANIFGVPPYLIGENVGATNVDDLARHFIMFTLQPCLTLWEDELLRSLLNESEQEEYFFEFLVDAYMRGNTLQRQEALAIQRQNGIINADEWREVENKNPLPDGAGKIYLNPLNMAEAGGNNPAKVKEPTPIGKGLPAPEKKPNNDPAATENKSTRMDNKELLEVLTAASESVLMHQFAWILRKEDRSLNDVVKGKVDIDDFYRDHKDFLTQTLTPYATLLYRQLSAILGESKLIRKIDETIELFVTEYCSERKQKRKASDEAQKLRQLVVDSFDWS
jgi:HK97 family phage portal protein